MSARRCRLRPRAPSAGGRSDSISQTFVPATINEPAKIARAQNGDLTVLHRESPPPPRRARTGAARIDDDRAAIVASSSVPVRTPVSSDGTPPGAARCAAPTGRQEPSTRAPQRAASAEHRRAAQHDSGDRVELVSGAGVRLRLPEVRDVDDRRDARRPAPTAGRRGRRAAPPGIAGVARTLRGEPDQRTSARPTTDRCSSDRVRGKDQHEHRQLRRDRRPTSIPARATGIAQGNPV